ncbi:MAG: hypothetical protein J6A97_00720 [Clostridia bacterium]|nr:hypothetical protein [Clostridia bacterium]
MNFNASNEFSQIISFLVQVFGNVISWLDGIIIIGDSTSLLDLNIALTVFGIIFVAVFNVVKSGAVNSMDSVSSSRDAQKRQERKSNREVKNEN